MDETKNSQSNKRAQRDGMNQMPDELKKMLEELKEGITTKVENRDQRQLTKEERDVVKKYKNSDVYRALRRLRSDEVKRKLDLKHNYGKDSLQYITSLHNYYTISPTRKILEHEYMREIWNLMQREGKDSADRIVNILEKYVQK